jgi:KTSC domain
MHETDFPESTALHSAAYDEETHELTIRLRTGRTYVYRDVPDVAYDGLVSADSAGRYYNLHIRDDYAFSEIVPYERTPDRPRRLVANPPSRRRIDFARVSRARRLQARRGRRG